MYAHLILWFFIEKYSCISGPKHFRTCVPGLPVLNDYPTC